MGIIQDLIDEGALILYHDYRAGHLLDLSGQGNDGVATAVMWGKGAHFPASTSLVTVADAAELQGTEFTLAMLGDFTHQEANGRFFQKRDAGGINYDFYVVNATNLGIYDGADIRTLATSIAGKRCVAINFANGETPEGFIDGLSAGNFSGVVAISADDADLIIGNYYTGNTPAKSLFHAALIVNRKLTASEHAALYAELESLSWPTKASGRARATLGPELLIDGDMEAAGTTAWNVGNSATLTKETGNALSESQVLRIAHNGVNVPNARQSILTVGDRYRITGWARGDGTYKPSVRLGGAQIVWIGETSTAWQYFDVAVTGTNIEFRLYSLATGAGWAEFDNVTVKKVYAEEVQFKTGFGAHAGNKNITAGFIENTPFEVVSGTHKVRGIISGEDTIKQIDTVVAGIYVLDGKLFHVNPALAAYGTWDFWLYKANASTVNIAFVSQALTGITAGDYVLAVDASEVVTLGISGGATLITSSMAHDEFVHLKITRRQSDGLFELFINDVSVGTATDTSLKTGAGMVFDPDAGDILALGTQRDEYALIKSLGVN